MPDTPPVKLTKLECLWLLRRLRKDRDAMHDDLMLLEERMRAGHDGKLKDAHRSLDNELMIADEVVRKLWATCGL